MATKCVVNKSTMTGIADAIRAKGGTSDTLLPSEMLAAIQAIPSGTAKVPYIYCDGSAFVTTNAGVNADSTVEYEFAYAMTLGESSTRTPIGCRLSSGNKDFQSYFNTTSFSSTVSIRFGPSTVKYLTLNSGAKLKIKVSEQTINATIGFTTYSQDFGVTSTLDGSIGLCVGGLNQNGNILQLFVGRLYGVKITRNGEVNLNLVPMKDSQGVGYFHDSVSGTDYYSDGTSDFVYGEE